MRRETDTRLRLVYRMFSPAEQKTDYLDTLKNLLEQNATTRLCAVV